MTLNGVVVTRPGTLVGASDSLAIDGKTVGAAEPTRIWLYHKPAGLVTTARDPEGRPTVFATLPKFLPRVLSVGRLDINTEGLLLLTNDGELARYLEHPTQGFSRTYRIRAHGDLNEAALRQLAQGITIDGMNYRPVKATLDSRRGTNCWLTMTLNEGKNREIKILLEYLGLSVTRLIRTAYGPFELGKVAPGDAEEVPSRRLTILLPSYVA